MNLIVRIPDELASRIVAAGGNLERRGLEALVLEEFRAKRVTKAELRRALGFETRGEPDGLLEACGVYEEYSLADFGTSSRTSTGLVFECSLSSPIRARCVL